MVKRIKWTHELRVKLYRSVVNVLGLPADCPRGSRRGKPAGMSQKEYRDTLDSIGVSLGLGKGKGGALSNQIAWVYAIPSKGCHQGHWNNRRKNLAAADEAGYFNKSSANTSADIPWGFEEESKPNVLVRMWDSIKSWFR